MKMTRILFKRFDCKP